jgi:LAGLIDADG endonuclease
MIVCRKRGDYGRKWKLSAAFNVSQQDPTPLELFRDTLGCGSLRRAGNTRSGGGGWYWEVNRLSDIGGRIVPFFERFPLVGQKANDFDSFRSAVALLSKSVVGDDDYVRIIQLREGMNRGGKRRYSAERILRDYTPTLPLSTAG